VGPGVDLGLDLGLGPGLDLDLGPGIGLGLGKITAHASRAVSKLNDVIASELMQLSDLDMCTK